MKINLRAGSIDPLPTVENGISEKLIAVDKFMTGSPAFGFDVSAYFRDRAIPNVWTSQIPGYWHVARNWSLYRVPMAADIVIFNSTSAGSCMVYGDVIIRELTVSRDIKFIFAPNGYYHVHIFNQLNYNIENIGGNFVSDSLNVTNQ